MSAAAQSSAVRLCATLGLIALLSGTLIAFTHQVTEKPIAENMARAMVAAVGQVIPGLKTSQGLVFDGGEVRACPPGQKPLLYAALDGGGRLMGFGVLAQSRGYAGPVEIMYAYTPSRDAVTGMVVLRSNETPGLGDKVISDPAFHTNFEALDVSLSDGGQALRNPVETVKSGKKDKPWQIDGISGATVSSKAVGRAVTESTARLIPALKAWAARNSSPPETP